MLGAVRLDNFKYYFVIQGEGIEAFTGPILPVGAPGIVNLKIDPFERTLSVQDTPAATAGLLPPRVLALRLRAARGREVRPDVHRLPAAADAGLVQHRRNRRSGEGADRQARGQLGFGRQRGRFLYGERPLPFLARHHRGIVMATNAGSHAAPPQSTPPRPGMVWIPGGTFRMGSDRLLPRRAARARGAGGRLLDRPPPGHQRAVCALRRPPPGYVTVAEQPPDPALYPGAPPENLVAGSMVFTPTSGPVDLKQLRELVGLDPGSELAPSPRTGKLHRRAGRSSGGAGGAGGRRGLLRLGGNRAAHGSRVGVCGARRSRRRGLHLGERGAARAAS